MTSRQVATIAHWPTPSPEPRSTTHELHTKTAASGSGMADQPGSGRTQSAPRSRRAVLRLVWRAGGDVCQSVLRAVRDRYGGSSGELTLADIMPDTPGPPARLPLWITCILLSTWSLLTACGPPVAPVTGLKPELEVAYPTLPGAPQIITHNSWILYTTPAPAMGCRCCGPAAALAICAVTGQGRYTDEFEREYDKLDPVFGREAGGS